MKLYCTWHGALCSSAALFFLFDGHLELFSPLTADSQMDKGGREGKKYPTCLLSPPLSRSVMYTESYVHVGDALCHDSFARTFLRILYLRCAISNDSCLHVFSSLGRNLEISFEEADFQLVSNVIAHLTSWHGGKLPQVRATS